MTTSPADRPAVSVVLNVMANPAQAAYGLRSWLLQDLAEPYEVILNVFNGQGDLYRSLIDVAVPACRVTIKDHPEPEYFNISASNNLGLVYSSGEYVFFANSDIIYPSHFASRALHEMRSRHLAYAIAGRANLTVPQTEALRPVASYARPGDFDNLVPVEINGSAYWSCVSPWMARRDVIVAVGGFDPQVLTSEDRDLNFRMDHYLRRQGVQACLTSLWNLYGYHQWHPSTGSFDAFTGSIKIIRARQQVMDADPASTADVIPTDLTGEAAMLEAIRATPKPPYMNQYRGGSLVEKFTRRFKKAWAGLRYG